MKRYPFFILLIVIIHGCSYTDPSQVAVDNLKCNWLTEPVGTGPDIVFSWNGHSIVQGNRQTACRIVVGTDKNSLRSEKDLIWDSGKVASSDLMWMKYSGPTLSPSTGYYWKVMIWDKNGTASPWSQTATFNTALSAPSDWSGASWIGIEDIPDSLLLFPGVHGNGNNLGNAALKRTIIPCFRKEFMAGKGVRKALLSVSGLGHYELFLNGKKVGNRFLSPGWTDYQKTVLFNTFDVTGEVKKGTNAIGIIAGNGFFNINRERYRKLVIAYGAPKVIMKLMVEFDNGETAEIVTDKSWKTTPSPITYSGIYGGEDYDARLEQPGWNMPGFKDESWADAIVVDAPGGIMKPETDHPVTVKEVFDPVKISSPEEGWFVYDFGQNASGIVKLSVTGKAGQIVKIWPGELIGEDSLVTQRATGGPYYFEYTLKGGKEEIWNPSFTYYGFRYAGVTGSVPPGFNNPSGLPVLNKLQLLHTRNSSPEAGSFVCSNQLFNQIYELIKWSVKSNLASVATDCPHREKLGWLEQTHLMGNSIRYLYDIRSLYNKIIDDMIDAQLENGLVPDIAPEYVPFAAGFRDSPEWGSACIILPWDMYNWYGDIDAVKRAYPMMKRYLSYLEGKSKDNILYHGLGDWYDLGPRSPGEAQLTPKAVTATSIYYYDAKLMAEMAALTGNEKDKESYSRLAEEIRISFNGKFFNEKTKVYSTGSQTAFAMPLYFGMADEKYREEIVKNLVDSIIANGKALTAGDVGYRYLLRVLEDEGYSRLISEMNSRTDVPGYGYQLSQGATSLTESWAALKYVSNNHMMLGHLMEWFFSGAGGIRQFFDFSGKSCIIISPEPVGNIEWAKTSYNSFSGKISTEWKAGPDTYTLKVVIPFGADADVLVPGEDPGRITVNGIPAISNGSVTYIEKRSGRSLFRTGSGEYTFVSPR